jgi:transposase
MTRTKRTKPPMALTGNQPNDDRRRAVIALYQSGLALRECAAALKVSFQAVHQILQRAGVPRRGRGGNQGSHSRRAR